MDHRAAVLTGLDFRDLTGLEIGPLTNPLVTRDQGRIFYADHCSTEALRAKYEPDPSVDVSKIVPVDFDLSTGSLPELVAGVAPFDYVLASHVAEHVPDLIGWLADVASVLRPGGVLALALPDKRFTFDLHRRETPVHELEAAHAERRRRPGLAIVLDHFLNSVAVDAGTLWDDPASGHDAPRAMSVDVVAMITADWHRGGYVDAHCWVFTPWSCLTLLGHAVERHALPFGLRWARSTSPRQLDFFVQLERLVPGAARTDWDAAARRMEREAERTAREHGAQPSWLDRLGLPVRKPAA